MKPPNGRLSGGAGEIAFNIRPPDRDMELVNTKIQLRNPRNHKLEPVKLEEIDKMDLIVIPKLRIPDVNPESPNIASSTTK